MSRANTASLSGHGSAKLGEQELYLQIAHRRTETTVRSGAEWHEGRVRPCRHDVLVVDRIGLSGGVLLSGFGQETDTDSGQQSGGTSGSSAKASISLCGGWAIRTVPLRTRYALRSHITLGTSRYGGHRHGLLVKIGLRSPRLPHVCGDRSTASR